MSDLPHQQSVSSKAGLREESWQREFRSHVPEYSAELAGTAFLVFCVVAAVAVMFAPASAVVHWIDSERLRLFVTGSILGGAGALVAITPLGRISGAHLNPAVSIGFYCEGKMHLQDLIGYVIAQFAGGAIGAWAGATVSGALGRSVKEALTLPAESVSNWSAAGAEAISTFALAFVIFEMLSIKRLMHWTPLVVVAVASILVGIDGNFSGASLNPARSFGPAWLEHNWHCFWVYVVGPCVGGFLAGIVHKFVMPRPARTGKLFHDRHYRSIFSGRSDTMANIHVRRQAGAPPNVRPPVHKSRISSA